MLYNEIIGFKNNCGVKAILENLIYYPFHVHENILEIVCIIDGKYKIYNGAHQHFISHGDVYFFNSSDSHKIERISDAGIILTIHIDLKHYSGYFKNYNEQNNYDIIKEAPFFICDSFIYDNKYSLAIKHLRFLVAKVYQEYFNDNYSEYRLEAVTKELIEYLLNNHQNYLYAQLGNGEYVLIQKEHSHLDEKSKRVYRLVDYIFFHSHEKVTLEDLAQKEFLNTAYLSTYIKQKIGLTFSEFLSITRCEAAERLLGMTSKNTSEIANEVGFSDRNHLSRQFQKWFSKTPSQYRKEIQADLAGDGKSTFDTFDYEFALRIIEGYLDGY